jgi:hypothetical protein
MKLNYHGMQFYRSVAWDVQMPKRLIELSQGLFLRMSLLELRHMIDALVDQTLGVSRATLSKV